MDINRKIAPLKKAEDAIEIDTTEMKIDDVIDFIVKYIHKGQKFYVNWRIYINGKKRT